MVVTSSMPAAIDALLYTITNLPAFATFQVVDGWPGPTQQTDIIAVAFGDDAASGAQASAYAGSARRKDSYDIKCVISCRVGGSANAEQKAARDRAFTALAALETAIRPVQGIAAGATLPDATGAPTVLYGQLTQVAYGATSAIEAPLGRFADIRFTVHCDKIL